MTEGGSTLFPTTPEKVEGQDNPPSSQDEKKPQPKAKGRQGRKKKSPPATEAKGDTAATNSDSDVTTTSSLQLNLLPGPVH